MSVKELRLVAPNQVVEVKEDGEDFIVKTDNKYNYLDRSQAHFLYLYLKERFEPK